MYAWFYNQDEDTYEYGFEGYLALISKDSFGNWEFGVFLAGRWIAREGGFRVLESAMVGASNAIWDDYNDSVTVLDFCGA